MHKYPQENQNITNVQTKLQRESLLCHFASTITKPTNERERERERERDFTTSDLRVHEREDEGRRDGDVD